ncbi:hypothetical protein SSPS47_25245 [Streptomyces sp. S4.7]|uniref:hypothetical protein n=1 Tax=Streptomyces sp. S4.7 TaxID=2705439 RepID=UPI0013980C57|nr:hypothetical protein [Streptomyces sp. S4.7]QHY98418.1 hypothetical protein SSPS47_25245 [Streptomyces sp. S4.7]
MTYFPDPLHAHEAADEERSERITVWLDRHDIRPYTAFYTVVDDALFAEDDAKLRGLYPPLGHGYPREDYA